MKNIKSIILLLGIILLCGCSKSIDSKESQDGGNNQMVFNPPKSNYEEDTKADDNKVTHNDSSNNSANSTTVNSNDTNVNKVVTEKPNSNNSTQSSSSETKLDSNVLDNIDNTKYSWWIKLNKENKPTEITPKIEKIIDKYDGIYIGDTSKKKIYLTFDEGYENGYTSQILDTLSKENVKSIFFITGDYLKKNPKLVKRMLDEGHQVGNHTVNHLSLPTLKIASLESEIKTLDTALREKFNVGFHYLRPPMGEYSERTLAFAKQMGYKTVFWSYAYLDYDVTKQKGAENAYNMVMNNLHDGGIYLLHAVSKDNTEALSKIINAIRDKGYEISDFDL